MNKNDSNSYEVLVALAVVGVAAETRWESGKGFEGSTTISTFIGCSVRQRGRKDNG